MKGNITKMKTVDYKHQLEMANKKLEEQNNRINEVIEYLQKEENYYSAKGIKMIEKNSENLLIMEILCTCGSALSIVKGDK